MSIIIQPLSWFGIWGDPPFSGVGAGRVDGPLSFAAGVGGLDELIAPVAGEIFSVEIDIGSTITAGEFRVAPSINGSRLPIQYAANANVGDHLIFRVLDAGRFFQAGDLIGCFAESDAGLLPNPTLCITSYLLVLNRGISTDQRI